MRCFTKQHGVEERNQDGAAEMTVYCSDNKKLRPLCLSRKDTFQ